MCVEYLSLARISPLFQEQYSYKKERMEYDSGIFAFIKN
jgi:hypothetical protein